MAKLIIKGIPDFTAVRAEIAKLQQNVASISSTPIKLGGTIEKDLKGASVAAGGVSSGLQKVVLETNKITGAQRVIKTYNDSLLETRQVIQKVDKETGELIVTQTKLTQNYGKVEAAAKKAAAADEKAARAANKYLLEQQQLAAKQAAIYKPTAAQTAIEQSLGIGTKAKSAEESAKVFEQSFLKNSDKIISDTKEMTKQNGLLGDSLGNIAAKMFIWQAMGTAVSKVIGTFREAIDTMKAVDDELVTVRKVTGAAADEMERLRKKAYETASAYGESADEYLNSVSAFARAGYGAQADALAELATKTKLVGDTSAEAAQQFLLSVDAAYQYKGNIAALTKVLDGANEIDNKYATSIEKIAEGLGIVAPVAAQAHVGIDELTAAIGTITAVTQRSGSEAARAFRALALNIVGDTKTEIEEGVTWTTGEIAGLRDIIKTYSKAAYEAAEATGSVINPMEAIAGLAQSMKDGLLTEQQLMETVSDIGGKLRTSQLLALIQNWDMYQSMLQDYGNAVGSADREIENAMDSWTRKTAILSNKWTELIQSFVSTEAIKDALDGVIALVDLLNSGTGRAVITAAGLTAGLVGIKAAVAGIGAAIAKIGGAAAIINPWMVALGALVAVIAAVYNGTEDYRKSLSELTADIADNTDKLKSNKERLEEINNLPWNEKTAEIQREKDAILAENAALEAQIQKLERIAEKKAKKTLKSASGEVKTGGYGYEITAMPSRYESIADLEMGNSSAGKQFETFEALRDYLATKIPAAAKMTAEEIRSLGIEFKQTALTANLTGEEYEKALIKRAGELSTALKENNADLETAQQEYDDLSSALSGLAEAHKAAGDGSTDAQAALDALNQAYDFAGDYVTNYVSELIEEKKAAGYAEEMIYKLVKAQILLNDNDLDLSQQIDALMQLAEAAGGVAGSIAVIGNTNLGDVERTIKGMLQTGDARTVEEARRKVLSNIYRSMFTDAGYDENGRIKSGNPDNETGTGNVDELERLKGIVALRKSELALMQERGDGTEAQIAKMREIQAALHSQADYMRKIGANQADINALSQEHWKITNQIKELQKQLWDELETAVNKKLAEAADARDREKDAIQAQIDALKAANEEEEKAADLEKKKADLIDKENALLEKQKALQEALNERTVPTYNAASGQWEWAADAKTVSSAESGVKSAQEALDKAKDELADYEKELALQAEIDELERKKALIDETYDTLKAEWEEITESLQEPSREIGEILSDIARTGLATMQEQVENVNSLLGKLNSYIAGTMGISAPGVTSGAGGAESGGGTGAGYHFDWSKAGNGGWTEEEMREGFRPASGTAAAIAAVSKAAGAVLTAGGLGVAGGLIGAIGSRAAAAANQFTSNNRTSHDHYGNVYNVAGVQLTQQQAAGMTLADLARNSRNLGIYK